MKPRVLTPKPSVLLSLLGGMTATLLASALLHLAPAVGLPFVDLPRLIGGVFTSDPETASGLGFFLFFLVGVLVFSPLIVPYWSALPGRGVGFAGALVKGALWGLILWAVMGLLLPLLGLLGRVEGLQNPGLLGFGLGLLGGLGLLVAFVAFGITLATVTAMGQGISPLNTIGWVGYAHAETAQTDLAFVTNDRSVPPTTGGSDTGMRA